MLVSKNSSFFTEDLAFTTDVGGFVNQGNITLLSLSNQYDESPNYWDIVSDINGDITYSGNDKSTSLTIGTGATDKIVRSTKASFPYIAGEEIRASFGVKFDTAKTNLKQLAGMFDEENGFYFLLEESGFGVARRSKASGNIEEVITYQSDWNLDKLNGQGKSRKTLDITKIQMLLITYTFYGAGGVTFWVKIDRDLIAIHRYSAGNYLNLPIVGNPSLPLRFEIRNSGVTASSSTMKTYGLRLELVGSSGFESGHPFACFNSNLKNVGTASFVPVLAIRPKFLFKGRRNTTFLSNLKYLINTEDNPCSYIVLYNPTLTGAVWTSNGDYTSVEFDVTATAYSGGIILDAGVLGGVGTNSEITEIKTFLPLAVNQNADISDIICIVARANRASTDMKATLKGLEIY